MLRMPQFVYHRARTVEEALGWMDEFDLASGKDPDAQAMFIAGGTDVLPNLKHRIFTPKALIGLSGVAALKGITFDPERGLRIGAGVRLSEIATSTVIQERFAALAEAAASVSTPQLRRMGTIGGNLCLDTRCNYYNQSEFWRRAEQFCLKKGADVCRVAPNGAGCYAVSSCDTAPVLIALDATARIMSRKGEREVFVRDLFESDGIHPVRLRADEVLTDINVPATHGDWRSSYEKYRVRGAFDFPIASVAASARFEGDVCAEARLMLQGVATAPVELPEAEALLGGKPWTSELLDEASDIAYRMAHPMDNTSGTIALRRRMTRSLTRQALEALIQSSRHKA